MSSHDKIITLACFTSNIYVCFYRTLLYGFTAAISNKMEKVQIKKLLIDAQTTKKKVYGVVFRVSKFKR